MPCGSIILIMYSQRKWCSPLRRKCKLTDFYPENTVFIQEKKSFLTIPTKCHFIKFNANAYLIFQAMEDLAGKNTEFSDTNSCV